MAGASNKNCPNCGKKMKQQFIGLQHCKCGMSWKKDIGYFERTSDMIFALERHVVKKGKNSVKTKQVPVIRYKDNENENSEVDIIEIMQISKSVGAMFCPISIGNFLKMNKKNIPTGEIKMHRAALEHAVQAKKSGTVCAQCGSPIWAIGTATVGWNGCFTCITGEADCSEDYEIDSVCF